MKRIVLNVMMLGFGLMFVQSCANRNVLPSYYDHAPNHHLIAILPTEISNEQISFTDEQEQLSIETEEQKILDALIFQNILKKVGLRRYEVKISLQSNAVTRNRLLEFGIDLNKIGEQDPVHLANLLGVDAVVKTKVVKTQLIAVKAEGAGLQASSDPIFFDEEEEDIPVVDKKKPVEKYRINLIAELVDARDGSLLWHFNKGKNSEIDYSVESSTEDLSRAMMRKFPYKNFQKEFRF
jgi:hypothetical protein